MSIARSQLQDSEVRFRLQWFVHVWCVLLSTFFVQRLFWERLETMIMGDALNTVGLGTAESRTFCLYNVGFREIFSTGDKTGNW
jgi:hypothetical protein